MLLQQGDQGQHQVIKYVDSMYLWYERNWWMKMDTVLESFIFNSTGDPANLPSPVYHRIFLTWEKTSSLCVKWLFIVSF